MGTLPAARAVASDLDPDAFEVRHLLVRDDVTLAYVREGEGGVPLVLLHGWPETMRIWWRNIAPLAAVGFDVIVPDLRGFGRSSKGGDGFYDLATHSRDVEALLSALEVRGCVVAAGDWGGGVAQDLANRVPGLIQRLVLFNTLLPPLPETWERAGVPGEQLAEVGRVSPHMEAHCYHADELAAKLATEEQRLAYVANFYLEGKLGHPGNFTAETAGFMAAPFGPADVFRTSLAIYEGAAQESKAVAAPQIGRIGLPTLILFGEADQVVGDHWTVRMALACDDAVGPYRIEQAGHFLQWEQADVFNRAVRSFCGDLLARRAD